MRYSETKAIQKVKSNSIALVGNLALVVTLALTRVTSVNSVLRVTDSLTLSLLEPLVTLKIGKGHYSDVKSYIPHGLSQD